MHHLKRAEPGKWHQQIRNLAGHRKKSLVLSSDDKSDNEIANDLNTHFANICCTLPPLDPSAMPAYLPAASPPPTILRHQVYHKLSRINTSKACHPGECPSRLLKEFAFELSEPITHIFNCCLREGCFPNIWKNASVCAIPKVSPVTSFDQLRPISITPIISRIFEGFLANWILYDIKDKIDPKQFGNRRGTSIVHCLVSLLDTVHTGIDTSGTFANLCTIDFSKAFDHVNHAIVIQKLIGLGVDRSIIPTLCSFLSQRTQTVRYHGTTSQERSITCGVPQGTRLGPILFLVLANDAAQMTENRWKYVDDLTLLEVINKFQPSQLQSHVDCLTSWCQENDVIPNAAKCKAMQVSFLRTPQHPPDLLIDSASLEIVSAIKLLGVIIQYDLKWDQQVDRIISNASRRLFIINKLKRNGVNTQDLVTIYQLYIRPVLEFAAPVWTSGITKAQAETIERIQKRALRIIVYPNLLPYSELLKTLKLESLSNRRLELATKFAKSVLTSPDHRHLLPQSRESITGRNLRNSTHMTLPRIRTQRRMLSPIPYFIQLLNSTS